MASQAAVGTNEVLRTAPTEGSVSTPFRFPVLGHIAAAIRSFPIGSWVILDMAILFGGIALGFELFVNGQILPYTHVSTFHGWATLGGTFIFASLVFGLYERETLWSRSRILTRLMLTCTTAPIIAYAIIYALMYTQMSRRVTALAIIMQMIIGGTIRLTACWALHRVPRNLILVGPGVISNALVRAFQQGFLHEYQLAGYVADKPATTDTISGSAWLGTTEELPEIRDRHNVQDIVVGAEAATDHTVMGTVLPCLRRGCRVTNEATFFEKATGQILVDEITPHWFLFADLQVHCQRRQALKRAFDIVTALIGVIFAIPLVPIIALAIKLNDRGPVFYWQTRVGQNGQTFKLFKFRTMRVGAETNTPVWAVQNDPRVTLVGRFLRKSRLDELPQLVNILLGQMSIVGPRPERPELVTQLTEHIPYYNERHLVKPGLTGWAQIGFRYGNTVEDAKRKLQYDLYYLKNISIELDLIILLRTLGVFVRGAF